MQKISSICRKGMAVLLVMAMVITIAPALDVFADVENINDGNEQQDVSATEIGVFSADEDDDHYEYDVNQKVEVKGKEFYYVKVDAEDIGRDDLELDFGNNNHVAATQVGDSAYYFASEYSSVKPDAYYYGSAGILYPDYWRNEGLSAPSAENWTASSPKVDSEGFNDMGGFDVISRATAKHGTYRAPFQFITDVYGYPVDNATDKNQTGPVERFVSEHDPLITTVDGRTSHARQPRAITSVPAELIASCRDGARDFEVNGVTYVYDHYEIRGIQRVPVKIKGDIYVGNLVLQAESEETIAHFEDFVLDGQDGLGLTVTASTGNMKELQANGEYGPVSAGVHTSTRAKVIADVVNVNNNHSWGDYAEAQIGIKHADGSTMTTEDMLHFVTRFTSATYEYYGTDSSFNNMVARYGTMASVDTWWSTNHGNRVDAGFMFDSYRLGGDGQNKNIQLGFWKVIFRAAGYEDLVATFELKPEISAIKNSVILGEGALILKDNINYEGRSAIVYTSSNEEVVKIVEIEEVDENGVTVVDRSGNPVMIPTAVAVSGGKATITATVNKDANGDIEASTSFEIVVDAKTTLNQSKYTLYTAGTPKTVTLKANVVGPSKTVTWTSSNTSVASVTSNGVVTARKAGTATITATANGVKATCQITVIQPSVKLDKSAATIYTKGSKNKVTLKAAVTGANKNVAWKSSNTKVATVNSKGVVTAKKAGKVTITATANGVSSKATITVKKSTLKLKKSKATIKTGKKVTIKATATPKAKITYKTNNKKIATVTSKGVVKGIRKGKATITVRSNGIKKTFKVTVK